MKKTEHTIFCCEPFKEMIGNFGWFHEPISEAFLMPYIQSGDNKWRVNYCPVCAENVRGIQIPTQQFIELTVNPTHST